MPRNGFGHGRLWRIPKVVLILVVTLLRYRWVCPKCSLMPLIFPSDSPIRKLCTLWSCRSTPCTCLHCSVSLIVLLLDGTQTFSQLWNPNPKHKCSMCCFDHFRLLIRRIFVRHLRHNLNLLFVLVWSWKLMNRWASWSPCWAWESITFMVKWWFFVIGFYWVTQWWSNYHKHTHTIRTWNSRQRDRGFLTQCLQCTLAYISWNFPWSVKSFWDTHIDCLSSFIGRNALEEDHFAYWTLKALNLSLLCLIFSCSFGRWEFLL